MSDNNLSSVPRVVLADRTNPLHTSSWYLFDIKSCDGTSYMCCPVQDAGSTGEAAVAISAGGIGMCSAGSPRVLGVLDCPAGL